jgi:hypothetical protein
MRYKTLLGWLAFGVLCGAGAQDLLPVTRVVLYRSGVGYIERLGRISGDATLTMSMRESQMNDLLKSLILVDFDGGQILPAQYTPRDPLERTLSAFAVQLSDNPSMSALLTRLRGAPVEIQTDKETLQGTVLSIETREEAASEVVVKRAYVNLMTNPAMRSVPLDTIVSLRVRDERLQQEIQNALAAIGTRLDNTRKTVELRFAGQGTRRVLVGYLTEMPLWKMTYRLALSADEPPLLQGWAIVENTTDEDWRNVRLELVSGRPVSFIQNLYEPIYPKRPTVRTQTDQALLPDTAEMAMDLAPDELAKREGWRRRLAHRWRVSACLALAAACHRQWLPHAPCAKASSRWRKDRNAARCLITASSSPSRSCASSPRWCLWSTARWRRRRSPCITPPTTRATPSSASN